MSDPSAALQKAIFTRLTAALMGSPALARVYDRVPPEPVFPYVTIADAQIVDDGAECVDAVEAFIDVHVWSRAVGSIEAKTVAGAVRKALHEASLSLGGEHVLLEMLHQTTRHLRDPDGLTSHSVVTVRALTEALPADGSPAP